MTDRLFLPFTAVGRARELRAIQVKERFGLSAYDAVDPYEILENLPARLLDPNCLEGCSEATRDALLKHNTDSWSAVCFGRIGSDGEALILLNPTHHPHRQRVSLMEEVVHLVLDHPPTLLEFGDDGPWVRPFDTEIENEAYSVGAACILPYHAVFNWIRNEGADPEVLAARSHVSTQYVEFRVRDAGLYRVYKKARRVSA